MRVLYVNADCGIPVFGDKGAAVHIEEMLRAFAAIGCETHLIATRAAARGAEASGQSFEVVAGPASDAAASGNREEKERRYLAAAEAVEERILARHAEQPFDLIYERYSLWSAAGVRAGARLGLPVIMEVNAPLLAEQSEFRKLVLADEAARIEAEVFRGADSLAAVSSGVARYAVSKGADPGSVHVLGNAVDTARFNPEARPDRSLVPEGAFVVGFTGSLKHWHGIDVLLEAFRQVKAEVPEAHLLIVGDGPKRGWVEGFLAGAGLTDAATLTGWVDHAALPGLIAGMDVATAPYPASDDFYFSPLKLYEYLAIGRPVVASRIGEIPEAIEQGRSGLLTEPGDISSLKQAIVRISRAPDLARTLAEGAAREGARHSWTRNARAVIDLAGRIRAAA